ncbi:MAG: hypothetical protein ACUVV4_06935 [Candidatus Bathyarchaeia archaeon]
MLLAHTSNTLTSIPWQQLLHDGKVLYVIDEDNNAFDAIIKASSLHLLVVRDYTMQTLLLPL